MQDAFVITPAATAQLRAIGPLGTLAAELFGRHLAGDWGKVTADVAQSNAQPDAPYRLSCFWFGEHDELCLAVVSTAGHCMLCAVEDLVEASLMPTPAPAPSGVTLPH